MFGKVAVVLENNSLVLMLERPHGYYHSNIYLTKKRTIQFTAINIDFTVAHCQVIQIHTQSRNTYTRPHTAHTEKNLYECYKCMKRKEISRII